jgi:ribosomal protein S18 acetylase RimI-like enzyme
MIQLIPMNRADYGRFLDWAVSDYAQEQVRAGTWKPKDARPLAEKAFESLLPEGLSSPNQYLYVLVDETLDRRIGFLWYGMRDGEGEPFAALYEIVIFEAYRRQGYGSESLRALEERVKELGASKIVLHVFGHNEPARAFYRKLGYVERNVTMAKDLGGKETPHGIAAV